MIKRKEVSDPNSCLNKADQDEPIFVLRGHDICAPSTIRHWAKTRVAIGKSKESDREIREAELLADYMEKWEGAHTVSS